MASVIQKGISLVRNKEKESIASKAANSPRLPSQAKSIATQAQSQSSTTATNSNELLISLEDLKKWTDSFDRLMESPTGRRLFREYLKSEYSEENLLFWEACNELRKERNKEKVPEKARQIYENYISILSPKEVSLDAQVREIINKNMVAPTAHAFDEAQLQIYTLMHRDSYPRFLASQLFKKISTNAVELDEKSKDKDKANSSTAAANSAHSTSSSAGSGNSAQTPNSHKKSTKDKSKHKDKQKERDKDKDKEKEKEKERDDHRLSPSRNQRH